MSEFNSFKKGLKDQFTRMTADHKNLFVTGVEQEAALENLSEEELKKLLTP